MNLSKYISRKFIIALLGFALCVVSGNTPGAIAIVLGYLGVEGAIDHKNAGA